MPAAERGGQALGTGIVARLCALAPARVEPLLYEGLAGDVTALKLLAPGGERVALLRLVELIADDGWNSTLQIESGSVAPVTDLVLGTAGVLLAAIWAGGEHTEDIAATRGEALIGAAEPTEAGLDWGLMPGWPTVQTHRKVDRNRDDDRTEHTLPRFVWTRGRPISEVGVGTSRGSAR